MDQGLNCYFVRCLRISRAWFLELKSWNLYATGLKRFVARVCSRYLYVTIQKLPGENIVSATPIEEGSVFFTREVNSS